MILLTPQNIASTKITVTNTATLLYSLMDTAGGVNSQNYYGGIRPANGIEITPEDGDIRIEFGLTPTALLGKLLSSGTKYFIPSVDLTSMMLIRVSGDVKCSLDLYFSEPTDTAWAVAEKVTLESEVKAWQDDRNAKVVKVDWRFTAADARIKLKHLYPVIHV